MSKNKKKNNDDVLRRLGKLVQKANRTTGESFTVAVAPCWDQSTAPWSPAFSLRWSFGCEIQGTYKEIRDRLKLLRAEYLINERVQALCEQGLDVKVDATLMTNQKTGVDYTLYELYLDGEVNDFFELSAVLGALDGFEIMLTQGVEEPSDAAEELQAHAELISRKHGEDVAVHVGLNSYEIHYDGTHLLALTAEQAEHQLRGLNLALNVLLDTGESHSPRKEDEPEHVTDILAAINEVAAIDRALARDAAEQGETADMHFSSDPDLCTCSSCEFGRTCS